MTTTTPDAAPARFGWCGDGHHKQCRRSFTSSQNGRRHECGCPCHRKAKP